MHIAFVTEKPFMARLIAPYAQRAFPDATLSFPVVWPIGLYGPTLPRGLSWRDYPHIPPLVRHDDTLECRKPLSPSDLKAVKPVSRSRAPRP